MNSIWNNNYSAFKNRFPALAQITGKVLEQPVAADFVQTWQLSLAKNDQFTVSENNLRLHSAYNPEREAFLAVNQKEIAEKSDFVKGILG